MQPMETLNNNYVNISFRVPASKLHEAIEKMASIGAEEVVNSIPWKEVYPNFDGSVALRGARHREGISQADLAKKIGVKQTHISEMEHGKRPIGKEMAHRLADALNVNYKVFL